MIQPETTENHDIARADVAGVFSQSFGLSNTHKRSLRFSPALRHHEYDENNHKLEEIKFHSQSFQCFSLFARKTFLTLLKRGNLLRKQVQGRCNDGCN